MSKLTELATVVEETQELIKQLKLFYKQNPEHKDKCVKHIKDYTQELMILLAGSKKTIVADDIANDEISHKKNVYTPDPFNNKISIGNMQYKCNGLNNDHNFNIQYTPIPHLADQIINFTGTPFKVTLKNTLYGYHAVLLNNDKIVPDVTSSNIESFVTYIIKYNQMAHNFQTVEFNKIINDIDRFIQSKQTYLEIDLLKAVNDNNSVKRPSIKTNSTPNDNSFKYRLKLLDTPYTIGKSYSNFGGVTWTMDMNDDINVPYLTPTMTDLVNIVLISKYGKHEQAVYKKLVANTAKYIEELFKTHKDKDITDTFDIYSYVNSSLEV